MIVSHMKSLVAFSNQRFQAALFTFTVAAYNLIRIPKLLPAAA